MFLDPNVLEGDPRLIEDIEKSSLRFVTQALDLFRHEAGRIFEEAEDWQADVGEDITAEALDSLGMSRLAQRVFGKMDWKRARYIFEPDYAVRQVLLVDSKAEKASSVARVQTSQTSMRIRQIRGGTSVDVGGTVPKVAFLGGVPFITTTIFVKYVYSDALHANRLMRITTACIPNGFLQNFYNPTPHDGIWAAGPNAPTRGEGFRTRLHLLRLKRKRNWRVQTIFIDPPKPFVWEN